VFSLLALLVQKYNWYKSTNTDAAHLSVAPPRRSNARSAARQTLRASGMARERVKKKKQKKKK
jgi:hypothetical protein